MAGKIVVDVYLTPKKNTDKPGPKAVIYSYVKDSYTGGGNVTVTQEGHIYVGDSKEEVITVSFVLQTTQLVWGAESYKAAYEAIPGTTPSPSPIGPIEKAEDLLWISRVGTNPIGKWPEDGREFYDFMRDPSNSNVVQVTMNRKEFTQTDYPYALAFNSYNSTGMFIASVRDDPQIRDRGPPQILPLDWSLYGIVGAGATILLSIFLTYRLTKRMLEKR